MDAHGASARRYMTINDPRSRLEAAASPPKASAKSGETADLAQQRDESSIALERHQEGNEEAAGNGVSNSQRQETLQRDLAYMQRRYRSAFSSTPSKAGKLHSEYIEQIEKARMWLLY